MIRYAVVGAGWIAQEAFIPGVANTGNSTIAAIVSGDLNKAQELADFHKIPQIVHYGQYDELLASGTIDAVYIALPNSMHADYAIRAANAGKHILVEKPIAISEAETRAMIAAAEDNAVLLACEYRLHNEPGNLAAIQAIRDGQIGDTKYIQAVFSFNADPNNHRLKAEHWGGPLQDVGIYCINAARYFFGAEPVAIQAMASSPAGDDRFSEVDATYVVTLRFADGRFAQFTSSFDSFDQDYCRIVGSKGVIHVEHAFRFEFPIESTLSNAEGEQPLPAPHVDHFGGITAYFSNCIINGQTPEMDGTEGLIDLQILVAIEEAIASGNTVAINVSEKRKQLNTEQQTRQVAVTDHRLVL